MQLHPLAVCFNKASSYRPPFECPDWVNTLSVARWPWPLPNVQLGASASTQPELERVAADLVGTPAAVRFLSLEPLLGPIEELPLRCPNCRGKGWVPAPDHSRDWCAGEQCRGVDWVIVGSESGRDRRECRDQWIDPIVQQCKAADIPIFVKQHHSGGRVVKAPPKYPQQMPEANNG